MNRVPNEQKTEERNIPTTENMEESDDLVVLCEKPGTQENKNDRQKVSSQEPKSASKFNSSQPRTVTKSKPSVNQKVTSASKSAKKTPLSAKKTPKWQKNAAADTKQKSMLDFFRPMFGKAKQTVLNIGAKFSPTSLLSPQSKSELVTKNMTESASKTCDNSKKLDQVVPSSTSTVSVPPPVQHSNSTTNERPSSSTTNGRPSNPATNSGTNQKPSVINKPWPLKPQATSKTGEKELNRRKLIPSAGVEITKFLALFFGQVPKNLHIQRLFHLSPGKIILYL